MERRALLSTTAAVVALPLFGGCAREESGQGTRTSRNANSPPDESAEMDGQAGGDEGEEPAISSGKGPVRGQASATVTVSESADVSVEYLDANETVKYVAAWRHTNQDAVEEGDPPTRDPVYDTVPFERWAKTQCVSAAAGEAADHVNTQLGTDDVGSGVTSSIEGVDLGAYVSIGQLRNREGDVLSEPSITFEELVEATPKSVDATYLISDRTYSMTVPMYAKYRVVQQE